MTSGPNPNVHTLNNFSSLAHSFFSRLCHWDLLILEHTERSLTLLTFETFDQSDEKTWPTKSQRNLENTFTERSLRLVTFVTVCFNGNEIQISSDFHPQNFPPNADMVIGKPGQERFWKGWRGLGGGAELQISDLLQEFHKRSNWT